MSMGYFEKALCRCKTSNIYPKFFPKFLFAKCAKFRFTDYFTDESGLKREAKKRVLQLA